MEKPPARPSVAMLAGKFKDAFPVPKGTEQKPKNPTSNPPKVKPKNSALIGKLQASISLPATALVHPPVKSPDCKRSPPLLSPTGRTPPMSPSEEEPPASFEAPAEASMLHSFNKGRARLSVKRRLPTRQHRKSYHEDSEQTEGEVPPADIDNSEKHDGRSKELQEAEHGQTSPAPPPEPVTNNVEDSKAPNEASVKAGEEGVASEDHGKDELEESGAPAKEEESSPSTEASEMESKSMNPED